MGLRRRTSTRRPNKYHPHALCARTPLLRLPMQPALEVLDSFLQRIDGRFELRSQIVHGRHLRLHHNAVLAGPRQKQ